MNSFERTIFIFTYIYLHLQNFEEVGHVNNTSVELIFIFISIICIMIFLLL
jgi:hypothetical protein